MGEYAIRKSDNTEIKIGTCESMYYIRYEDRNKVKKMENSLDCSKEIGLFWRIPFPDEDNIKIGDYEPFNRGYLLPGFKIEDADKDKGIIQLSHKSGLLLNVTCYHGERLPESTAEIMPFWNGKDPNAYELISIKNNPTEIRYVVRCKFCEKMWSYTWDEIKDYINNIELKARLEAYNKGGRLIMQPPFLTNYQAMTKQTYGEHYPYHKVVPIVVKQDKNGKTLYYQALNRLFIKRIGQAVVDSLKAEGRAVT